MSIDLLLPALIGLLPVLIFLAALRYLDSYKLAGLPAVIGAMACGALMAGLSYWVGGQVLGHLDIGIEAYSRYVSPLTEELLKCLLIVALIRTHRIGFLVDAAIFGFAVGTGFALVENLYFLALAPGAVMATWVARGFGVAIMHGGTTAIFALMALAMLERSAGAGWRAYTPGFALAAVIHSAFNHLSHEPRIATLAVMIALPLLLYLVFERSEAATRDWLRNGFDTDVQMLDLLNSGGQPDSPPGRYLRALRDGFKGPELADVLCYLRLYTELALRAKGLLMMRENGFEVELDDAVKASVAKLQTLEASIGKTGLRAVRPLLGMSHKDLWQLYMLKEA